MRKLALSLAGATLALASAPAVRAQEPEPEAPPEQDTLLPYASVISPQLEDWSQYSYEERGYGQIVAELREEEQPRFRDLYAQLYPHDREALLDLSHRLAIGERGILAAALIEQPVETVRAFLNFVAYLPSDTRDKLVEEATDRHPRNWRALLEYTRTTPYAEVAWSLFVAEESSACPQPVYPGPQAVYREYYEDGTAAEYSYADGCSPETRAFMSDWNPDAEYVVIGQPTREGDAPWQAQLIRSQAGLDLFQTEELRREELENFGLYRPDWEARHLCGGVFIGTHWVITAAHCISGWNAQDLYDLMRVRLGSRHADGGGWQYRIVGAAVHARYTGKSNNWLHDIALLRLASDVEIPGIERARIPGRANRNQRLDADLQLTGWGVQGVTFNAKDIRDADGALQRYARILQRGDLTLRDPAVCGNTGQLRGVDILPGQLCAGNDDGVDACRGDSGGPLVLNENGERELVGLVSYGAGCGLNNTAKIFTDVGYYRDWIAKAKRLSRLNEIVRVGCDVYGFSVC